MLLVAIMSSLRKSSHEEPKDKAPLLCHPRAWHGLSGSWHKKNATVMHRKMPLRCCWVLPHTHKATVVILAD